MAGQLTLQTRLAPKRIQRILSRCGVVHSVEEDGPNLWRVIFLGAAACQQALCDADFLAREGLINIQVAKTAPPLPEKMETGANPYRDVYMCNLAISVDGPTLSAALRPVGKLKNYSLLPHPGSASADAHVLFAFPVKMSAVRAALAPLGAAPNCTLALYYRRYRALDFRPFHGDPVKPCKPGPSPPPAKSRETADSPPPLMATDAAVGLSSGTSTLVMGTDLPLHQSRDGSVANSDGPPPLSSTVPSGPGAEAIPSTTTYSSAPPSNAPTSVVLSSQERRRLLTAQYDEQQRQLLQVAKPGPPALSAALEQRLERPGREAPHARTQDRGAESRPTATPVPPPRRGSTSDAVRSQQLSEARPDSEATQRHSQGHGQSESRRASIAAASSHGSRAGSEQPLSSQERRRGRSPSPSSSLARKKVKSHSPQRPGVPTKQRFREDGFLVRTRFKKVEASMRLKPVFGKEYEFLDILCQVANFDHRLPLVPPRPGNWAEDVCIAARSGLCALTRISINQSDQAIVKYCRKRKCAALFCGDKGMAMVLPPCALRREIDHRLGQNCFRSSDDVVILLRYPQLSGY